VVVMRAGARDIGVLAIRQVDALDDTQLSKEVERAKKGRPADAQAPPTRGGFELQGSEVPVVVGDQICYGAPWSGHPVAGQVNGIDD
jgi:hypothetical protein